MQGFNMGRYYAPSTEHAPTFNTTHPLGARARKAGQGLLTVRFEMPFAIWCDACPKPTLIGQGVRFNAEKRRAGQYHSTPVWAFRMRHAACGGEIEIRTDPARTEYVVTEGARRRDYGDARRAEDEEARHGVFGEVVTEEERERRRNDAFAALEGKKGEKERARAETDRVEELKALRERDWEDPYAASKRLRQGFRVERKVREGKAKEAEGIKDKYGLDFELAAEDEGDTVRAEAVEFGLVGNENGSVVKAIGKPLFGSASSLQSQKDALKKRTKAELEKDRRRSTLQQDLQVNTRANQDPFLLGGSITTTNGHSKSSLSNHKRKRPEDDSSKHDVQDRTPQLSTPARLVDYESD